MSRRTLEHLAHTQKGIGKSGIEALLSELQEVRRVATMDSASFNADFHGKKGKPIRIPPGGVTAFIRQETKNWREAWILGPLDNTIAYLQVMLKKKEGTND